MKNEMDLLKAYRMSSVFYCHFSPALRGRGKNTVSVSTEHTDSFQKPTVVKIPCSLLSSTKPFYRSRYLISDQSGMFYIDSISHVTFACS